MAQLSCENLILGYEGKPVSTNVNFQIYQGDYLCILGENGSGKSTLIKALLGLIKPMGGYIKFGEGLSSKDIGYLPQQTPVQRDFPASAAEIVMSGFLGSSGLHPFYSKTQKSLAKANMEKLGIFNLRDQCYRDLSGGQQQRVLLARALCATSKMLLLDEPVSGLDPVATGEMYSIIEKLNKEEKITIIMVSHDVEAAVKYATHILHMGKVVEFFGTKEEYINSPVKSHFNSQI